MEERELYLSSPGQGKVAGCAEHREHSGIVICQEFLEYLMKCSFFGYTFLREIGWLVTITVSVFYKLCNFCHG